MTKTLRALYQTRDDFLPRLVILMDEAHRRGLHRTGHVLHEAVRTAGWEVADQLMATLKRRGAS